MFMKDSAWKSWYHDRHISLCIQRTGNEFEAYVTSILKLFYGGEFINPDPSGSLGDGGCDGIAENGAVIYACYGTNAHIAGERNLVSKLESDFNRALQCWSQMSVWRFVTNARFGPLATEKLLELRKQHDGNLNKYIQLEVWKPEDLRRNIVSQFDDEKLNYLLPGVPHVQEVGLEILIELIDSVQAPVQNKDGDVRIGVVSSEKMKFNNLSEHAQIEFNNGRQLAPRITRWFNEQGNPELYDEKAQQFRAIYKRIKGVGIEADEILERLYIAIGGQDFRLDSARALGVYAVTSYFFDNCDIFEDPYAASQSMTLPHGHDAQMVQGVFDDFAN